MAEETNTTASDGGAEVERDLSSEVAKTNQETEKDNQQTSAKENYQSAYMNSLELRTDFAKKPGYVREKQPDELAYHAVKKEFGEFRPNDREAMERNTNNDKGADVQLPDGEKVHIENQAQLYDKVVEFNKERGRFYDEPHIEKTSPEDHQRLIKTNEDIEKARKEFLEQYTDRKEGYKEIRTAEDYVKNVYEEMKQLKSQDLNELKKPLTVGESEANKTEDQAVKVDTDPKDKLLADKLGLSQEEMANVRARSSEAIAKEAEKQDREAWEAAKAQGDAELSRLQKDNEKGSVADTAATVKDELKKPVDDEKTIEAEKIGDKPPKQIPDELNNKYVIDGDNQKGKYYFKDKPDVEAFRDRGAKLITKSSASSVAKSMVTLAETKQWETIKLSGSEKFRREVWMEAKLRGMEVEGYKPSEQDLQNLENKLNKIENAEPNASKEAVQTAAKVATTQAVKQAVSSEEKAASDQAKPGMAADEKTTIVEEPKQPEFSATDRRIIDKRQELWEKEKAAGNQVDTEQSNLSTADKKVIEIRDRLDREAKEQPTANGEAPRVDSEATQERSKKDELRKAYADLPKDEAIKKHPELEPLYNLEKAANQFVNHDKNKGKFDAQGKERFVTAVREKGLDTLDRGEKLPTIQERVVETNTQTQAQEKDQEISR